MKKYISLQVLRGLAAWVVVFHHYVQSFYVAVEKTPSKLGELLYIYGKFGVDIFFVLSGFIMFMSVKDRQINSIAFFQNRLLRIVPAYWFFTIFMIISLILIPESFITSFNSITVIKSLVFIPSKNPGHGYYPVLYVGWTLAYELCFYTILSFCIGINKKYPLLTCCVVLFLLGAILGRYRFLGKPNYLFLEFMLGIIIGHIVREYNNYIEKYKSMLTFICIAMIVGIFYFFKLNMYIAGLILFTFIIQESLFTKYGKVTAVLSHLGDISYSTYLVHIIIIGWLYHIFGNDNSIAMEVLILSMICCIVYFISALSFKYIENASWINKLKAKISKAYPVRVSMIAK